MEEKNNHTMIWDKEVKYTASEKEDLERTRDMFAGIILWENHRYYEFPSTEAMAKHCYDLADAMIKEKQRRRNICNVDETKDK